MANVTKSLFSDRFTYFKIAEKPLRSYLFFIWLYVGKFITENILGIKSHGLFIFYKVRKRRRSRKSIKRSLQEYCRDNVTNIYIQTRIHSAEYINSKNIENTPRRTEWMTYNAKQCLQVVVAKQRRMLPNDVMFRKTKMFK